MNPKNYFWDVNSFSANQMYDETAKEITNRKTDCYSLLFSHFVSKWFSSATQ